MKRFDVNILLDDSEVDFFEKYYNYFCNIASGDYTPTSEDVLRFLLRDALRMKELEFSHPESFGLEKDDSF